MSNRRHAILMFLCVTLAALAVFVRHNAFPFYYHPDESGKVQQIIRHKRNFNHPMMMLSTVDVARYIALPSAKKKDSQSIGEVGRWCTAIVAAATAAALALLALRAFGGLAGWTVGILAITNPLLFELAHYFKEDPWLMFGIAVTCVALNGFSESASPRRLHLLAAACAMAAAGKYVGFAFLPVGAALVWRRTDAPLRKKTMLRFLGTFLGVWLLFNLPFLRTPGVLFESLQEESTKLAGMTDGVSRKVPHAFYIMTQSLYGGWTLPIISLVWLAFAVRTPRKITVAEWVLAITAVAQFVLFSFVPKTAFRYHLPVSLAFAFLAVAGFARLLAALREKPAIQRIGMAAAVAALSAAVFFQVKSLRELDASFTSDDREKLLAFIQKELPPEAVLAADIAVNLPQPTRWEHAGRTPLAQKLVGGEKEVADLGTVADLRAKGVTHVAICERTYGRYLDDKRSTKTGSTQTPERTFYETLLKKGKVVWSSPLGRVTYLQPGLKLVDITGL